jgi:small subunit ribosomal protein S16
MAKVMRLTRMGKKKNPFYRIVVMDSRQRRDAAYIDLIGYYDPMKNPAEIKIYDEEKTIKHLMEGSLVSETVKSILSNQGILKKFHEKKYTKNN